MNALPVAILATVALAPLAWLWWEDRHPHIAPPAAVNRAAADPDVLALPCLEAAAVILAEQLWPEVEAFLGEVPPS